MAFRSKQLDIVVLNNAYTDDDIEEMFLRLQNGTPLNAAEKRRAISGNVRNIVEELSRHKIFKLCSFSNKRYAYEDAIAKIIHIVFNGNITDIKPTSIKKTYEYHKDIDINNLKIKEIKKTLNFIEESFKNLPSPNLKKFSIITLSYLTMYLLEKYNISEYKKEFANAYHTFELERQKK